MKEVWVDASQLSIDAGCLSAVRTFITKKIAKKEKPGVEKEMSDLVHRYLECFITVIGNGRKSKLDHQKNDKNDQQQNDQ